MFRLIASSVGLASVAIALVGCRIPFGEQDPCDRPASQPSDAAAPVAGTQKAQLTWVETGTKTDFSLTIEGPFEVDAGCPGQHQDEFRFEATSGDGLIAVTDEPFWLDTTVRLGGVDATKLLQGGVAPDQPDLASQNPSIELELVREGTTWLSGTVRAKTADEQVTLGLITFEPGS